MKDIIFKFKFLPEMLLNAFVHWKDEVWDIGLDDVVCCYPSVHSPCGCQATTHRQQLKMDFKK